MPNGFGGKWNPLARTAMWATVLTIGLIGFIPKSHFSHTDDDRLAEINPASAVAGPAEVERKSVSIPLPPNKPDEQTSSGFDAPTVKVPSEEIALSPPTNTPAPAAWSSNEPSPG